MMYSSGDAIPLWVNLDAGGSATAAIRRIADGFYLDFSDNTFKASPTTQSVTLTEQGNQWIYSWDSTGLAATEAACVIEYTVDGCVFSDELQLNFGGGSAPTAEQNAAAVWAYVMEGAATAVGFMRLFRAVLLGKTTDSGTKFRDAADTKDRVVATIDGNSNRTAVTTDDT